jgi:hypothetical protein
VYGAVPVAVTDNAVVVPFTQTFCSAVDGCAEIHMDNTKLPLLVNV